MKKLYIIRHAKSSWKNMDLDDFDRPLNKRGKLNAPFMGAKLKSANIKPDIILSSPALRAKKTAKIIAKEVEYLNKIVFDEDMYDSSVSSLHMLLTDLEDKDEKVFLFGHNPELNMLAEYYIDFNENIPTCGIIAIYFECNEWRNISPNNARFISFDYPKKV